MSPAVAPAVPSAPSLEHLVALTDRFGLYEHAEGNRPRPEHGYCLDDVARAFAVVVRMPADATAATLLRPYLSFVEDAIVGDGRAHNRRDREGRWTDVPGLGDWWGRAVAALGTGVARGGDPVIRRRAMRGFERAAVRRSPHLRATAYAAIGAADVRVAVPDGSARRVATALLHDAAASLRPPVRRTTTVSEREWSWPEPTLRYANAVIPEALLAVGSALEDADLIRHGLDLLSFLLATETRDGHLSVTGVGGRGLGDDDAQFDQQPIEVAALAEAAWRALGVDPDERWRDAIQMAWAWFEGDNDSGVPMIDLSTGAGFDGLHAASRNSNRGAESTLAALSTHLRFAELTAASPGPPRLG